MKPEIVLELIDLFVPESDRDNATRWLLNNRHRGWGGARKSAGRKKSSFQVEILKNKSLKSDEKKSRIQDENLKKTPETLPTVRDIRTVEFNAGYQGWTFPMQIKSEATKIWRPETIREIEIFFCCREYSVVTTINQLLERWPADIGKKNEFIVPDTRFMKPWLEWLDYKKSKRQGYKPASLPKVWKQLIELSNNDPRIAQMVVDQSIAAGWQGLFPLKNNTTAPRNLATAQKITDWIKQ